MDVIPCCSGFISQWQRPVEPQQRTIYYSHSLGAQSQVSGGIGRTAKLLRTMSKEVRKHLRAANMISCLPSSSSLPGTPPAFVVQLRWCDSVRLPAPQPCAPSSDQCPLNQSWWWAISGRARTVFSCHVTSAEGFKGMKEVLPFAAQAEPGSLRSDSAATNHLAKLEFIAARLMLVACHTELQIRMPISLVRSMGPYCVEPCQPCASV